MEPPGQTAEAVPGIGHHGLGGFQAFSGGQGPFQVGRGDALQNPGDALQALLSAEVVAAGIEQVEAVDAPGGFGGAGGGQQETGIRPVGGAAGGTLQAGPGHGHRRDGMLHLGDPAAGEGVQGIAARKLRAGAHEFVDRHRLSAPVFQHCPAGEYRGQYAVIEGQLKARFLVLQAQGEDLLPPGEGQPRGGRLLQNFPAGEAEIGGHRGPLHRQLHRAFPEVAPAGTAPLQGVEVQTAGAGTLIVESTAAPAAAGDGGQRLRVGGFHPPAEMQMLRIPVHDPEEVGIFFILQMEYAVFDRNHWIWYASSLT